MKSIAHTLRILGLSQTESEIYYTLIEKGKMTALALSKETGIKRPTCYFTLDELKRRGFVRELPSGKTTYFLPENPKLIVSQHEERLGSLHKLLPNLLALYEHGDDKPRVTFYEGDAEIIRMYEQILLHIPKKGNVYAVSNLHEQLGKEWIEDWFRMVKNSSYNVCEILVESTAHRAYAARMQHIKPSTYQIRFLGAAHVFLHDIVMFEGKIIIFSGEAVPYALVIESKSLFQSFTTLFQIVWGTLKPE